MDEKKVTDVKQLKGLLDTAAMTLSEPVKTEIAVIPSADKEQLESLVVEDFLFCYINTERQVRTNKGVRSVTVWEIDSIPYETRHKDTEVDLQPRLSVHTDEIAVLQMLAIVMSERAGKLIRRKIK